MIRRVRPRFLASCLIACAPLAPLAAAAQVAEAQPACEQGRIARIEITSGSVFSPGTDDAPVLRWIYQAANELHVRTSRDFLKKGLPFDVGDCFDPRLLAEAEQSLGEFSFLRGVTITHVPNGDGSEVVRVVTQDEWTTQADVAVSYDDGLNVKSFGVLESNLLGQGVRLSVRRRQFREDHSQSVSLSWPYLIRYARLRTQFSTSASGASYGLRASRPFVGDQGRNSLQLSVDRSAGLFSYGAAAGSPYSHVLVPLVSESESLQYGRRWGTLRHAWILGARLERRELRPQDLPEYVFGTDFAQATAATGDLPGSMSRQLGSQGATLVSLHVGARSDLPVRMVGLDGVRDVQSAANGYLVALAAGRSIRRDASDGATAPEGFAHFDAAIAKPAGSSYVRAGLFMEAARAQDAWSDVMGGAEAVAYGRARWLPNQTLFVRASGAGGWRTTVPFQLTLGGLEGVRSLQDDAWPGGRRFVLTAEDRIRLDWPDWQAADLGLTVFGDVGRMWQGDAPYGLGSTWKGSVGFGLRVGAPRGTQFVWRPEVALPVGGGAPVFRIALESNRLRDGFAVEKLLRSMRFNRGVETF